MKVVVNNQVFDSEEEVITIIWDTDKERIASGKHISEMLPKKGFRAYMNYPDSISNEMAERIFEEIKKKLYGGSNESNSLEHSISG